MTVLARLLLALLLAVGLELGAWNLSAVEAAAQTVGEVPGNTLGNRSDSEFWRGIRSGQTGSVSTPDERAGVLIQSEGDNWRARRNGPVSTYGAWLMLTAVVLVAAFFAVRGRIRIDGGWSGRTILRFTLLERFGHWLTAISFLILALTGLNILYGRYVFLPLIGPEAFAAVTLAGKYAHHYVAFAFMAGLLLIFVLWVRQNLPDRYDLGWVAKGGGLLRRGVHPPAGKFNFGQKIVFWGVALGGVAVSLTGINLMFPFTFTDLAGLQTAQLAHSIAAIVLTALIIGHIYIGTLGMEGAVDAMLSGRVDINWAREHHSAWVEETRGRHGGSPAE